MRRIYEESFTRRVLRVEVLLLYIDYILKDAPSRLWRVYKGLGIAGWFERRSKRHSGQARSRSN